MIAFGFGIVIGLAIGLLIGANNSAKVKKAASAAEAELKAKIEELKARQ